MSPPELPTRVFGGQVAGQALVAAGRTVPPERQVHSLHAYFIRPGDPQVPIVYQVERVRDGHSFATRRVLGIQHGQAIFALSASFQLPQEGLEHADPMPAHVPDPETLPDVGDLIQASGADNGLWASLPRPIDLRYVEGRAGRRAAGRRRPGRSGSGCGPTESCPTTGCCTSAC